MKLSRKKVSLMIPSEIRSEIDKVMNMLDELWSDKFKKKSLIYLNEREEMLEDRLSELERFYPMSLEITLDKRFVTNMEI
jgi:hypothetical protein